MQDAIILYENGKAIGGEGHPTNASDITFDNTGTDLVSEEVESAIKEAYGKSAKSADLTSIFESGTTASQAISERAYFYLNGTLVKAKTAIANGATFTENTNYKVVNGVLNEVEYTNLDNVVNLSTYTNASPFTAPNNGYVVIAGGTGEASVSLKLAGGGGFPIGIAKSGDAFMIYVLKGMQLYKRTLSGTGEMYYYEIV